MLIPTQAAPIGLFGGTFDPPHFGHLRPALELCERFAMQHMLFIPANVPPHRPQPMADAEQRLSMLKLAVAEEPSFRVDERELRRPGPSYMVDTLQSLRQEYPSTPLCLCLGMDAFLQLHSWHRWQELGELANILVSHRPGWEWQQNPMDKTLKDWFLGRHTEEVAEIRHSLAGKVCLQQVSQLAISATGIRARASQGLSARFLLPEPVWRYIQQQQLYLSSES